MTLIDGRDGVIGRGTHQERYLGVHCETGTQGLWGTRDQGGRAACLAARMGGEIVEINGTKGEVVDDGKKLYPRLLGSVQGGLTSKLRSQVRCVGGVCICKVYGQDGLYLGTRFRQTLDTIWSSVLSLASRHPCRITSSSFWRISNPQTKRLVNFKELGRQTGRRRKMEGSKVSP